MDSVNVPGGRDTIGHSSVQAWSAGDFFPAVIAVVERYVDLGEEINRSTLAARLLEVHYDLTLDGITRSYATYDDAAAAARYLVRDAEARHRWGDGAES